MHCIHYMEVLSGSQAQMPIGVCVIFLREEGVVK